MPKKVKDKNYLIIGSLLLVILLLLVVIVIVGDFFPIERIRISDDDSQITIIKNKWTETASINMVDFVLRDEIKKGIIDLTEPRTEFSCNLLRVAFFENQGLGDLLSTWTTMRIEGDEKIDFSKEHILEGYEVKKITWTMRDKESNKRISSCIIDSSEKDEMEVKYY